MALESAVAAGDAVEVLRICEESELQAAEDGFGHPFPTEHMLSLILMDDLDEARFLWRRLSDENRATAEPAWALVKSIWRHDYSWFYKSFSHAWPDSLRPLMAQIVSRMRLRMVDLVNSTYSVILEEKLCNILGVDPSALDIVCREQMWKREGGYIIIPQKTDKRADRNMFTSHQLTGSGLESNASSESRKPLSELETLTEQLVKLQTT